MPLHPSYSGRAEKSQSKPLNYSQVTEVQGPDENPLIFLQHLKDAIQKHTTVDPESQVGDKILTQSAPDSHRNSKRLKGKNHWIN
jgi:hypothetical protein